jgi:hypothetical protein
MTTNVYWIIHYTDTLLNGKELGWDVVTEEETDKIALFTKKEVAEEEANNLDSEFRMTQVIPLELTYLDKNYFIIVDK